MIPDDARKPSSRPTARPRRDGWTSARREAFLEALAAGLDVRRACTGVGLSREGAYRLRARDAAFAAAWDAALQAAGVAEEQGFLELLAERLPAIAADVRRALDPGGFFLSGPCNTRSTGVNFAAPAAAQAPGLHGAAASPRCSA